MTIVLSASPQYCCYTTLWNAEVIVWLFTTMNSYCIAHAGSESHWETTKSLKICYFFNINQERVYRTKISDVDELKRRINSEWATLTHTVIECVVGEWRSIYVLAFVLEQTFWAHTVIKMMWGDTCDLFWETILPVTLLSVAIQLIIQIYT